MPAIFIKKPGSPSKIAIPTVTCFISLQPIIRFCRNSSHHEQLYLLQHITRDRVLDILDAVDPETEPLFLYLPFQSAHGPLQVTIILD